MRLNRVTVTMPDLDAGWNFYCTLGLKPVVDARPHYARTAIARFHCIKARATVVGQRCIFECDNLDETVSQLEKKDLHFTSPPEDKSWLWREAELFDPGGNRVLLYFAGQNRINPPWRVK